ncbi:unnamed protein product, partial [Pylaiella littoralis]
ATCNLIISLSVDKAKPWLLSKVTQDSLPEKTYHQESLRTSASSSSRTSCHHVKHFQETLLSISPLSGTPKRTASRTSKKTITTGVPRTSLRAFW